MPITNSPTMTTSSGVGGGMTPGGYNPFANLNLPQFQFATPDAGMAPNFQSIMQMLTQQPTSMVNQLMPGLEQILGLQTQSMLPMYQQQTGQMMAQAQSGAQQRGLTGSSIEAANILGAQSAGMQNMNQFMGQQLGQLGSAYTGAMGTDVTAQNQLYQNIAQAMGQQMQSEREYQMFQQMIEAQRAMASSAGKSGMWGSLLGGLGTGVGIAGGALLSDERLKTNKIPIGTFKGLTLYSYEYKPEVGISGNHFGFMAQEVEKKFPDSVFEENGFKMIDLDKFIPELQGA